MTVLRDIFVQHSGVDSCFVTVETGCVTHFATSPGLDEQQEELKID